jgi:hypothetical protein
MQKVFFSVHLFSKVIMLKIRPILFGRRGGKKRDTHIERERKKE